MEIKRIVSSYLDSNTFVLIENNEALIIDCGATVNEVEKVVQGNKVVGVLLTHGHYDHALNCLEYADQFGVKIFANVKAKRALLNPEINYGDGFSIEEFSGFDFLKDDGELTIGKFRIRYFSTPGHSECSMSYLIDKHLFVGDCMFAEGIGRMDLVTSDKQDMLDSLKKLSLLDYFTCYSGHYEDAEKKKMDRNLSVYIRYLSRNNTKKT